MIDLSNSKVCVIGGAGAIGSHVIDLLVERGAAVTVLDNFYSGSRSNLDEAMNAGKVELIEGDMCDRKILDDVVSGHEYVFLLAAVRILDTIDNPRLSLEVNMNGTYNVLEACEKHKIKKVIYSSSASVFGDPKYVPVDEDHPFQTNTAYGASKISAEQYFWVFYQTYKLPFVGLRYFNVYGPRQDYRGKFTTIIPRWLDCIDEEKPITIFGDGSQTMDCIYIKDVAKANICALDSPVEAGFYNIGTGKETSVKQLADTLLKLTGSSISIQYQKEDVNLVQRRQCDPKKTKSEIGFEAKMSLEDGLRGLIDWRKKMIEKETA